MYPKQTKTSSYVEHGLPADTSFNGGGVGLGVTGHEDDGLRGTSVSSARGAHK